ncbi:MAG: UDP-N-acetylmuramate dehydrogenase [Syntrophomonadaceae bacterium]|nr:UDP-N-acetylmuramate dehydrogenase [Syntrophomonadaceae bacterium]
MRLENLIPAERIKYNEPMRDHTTFRIGGPADIMVMPESIPEIIGVLEWARKQGLTYLVIGEGSNLLVKDGGIRGVVIKLGAGFSRVEFRGTVVEAQAGIKISQLAAMAADRGLSGLEFAEGIPGSLGGAVYMNAGAYGGEISQVTKEVTVLSEAGEITVLDKSALEFGYRTSSIQKKGYIVLQAKLVLHPDEPHLIKERMQELSRQRREKQPLEYPSAGSAFKRPPGRFVGPMIEELGLKGCRVGDAEVSTKHAGFIINRGRAAARDVLALVSLIKRRVKEKYGIELETEFLIVGED